MIDLVGEVDLVARLEQLHNCFRAVMRGEMEISWHLMKLNSSFQLATLVVFDLFLGLVEDDSWVSLFFFLLERVDDTLSFALLVERVFVQTAFDAHLVNSGHVDHVKGQDSAGGLW